MNEIDKIYKKIYTKNTKERNVLIKILRERNIDQNLLDDFINDTYIALNDKCRHNYKHITTGYIINIFKQIVQTKDTNFKKYLKINEKLNYLKNNTVKEHLIHLHNTDYEINMYDTYDMSPIIDIINNLDITPLDLNIFMDWLNNKSYKYIKHKYNVNARYINNLRKIIIYKIKKEI